MQEITSVNNPIVKEVHSLQQKKYRNELGLFLIEGYKGVTEAIKSGLNLKYIFIDKDFAKSTAGFPDEKVYRVNSHILKKISTTDSPPEIVGVAEQLKFSLKDLLKSKNPLILVLENIKDPGNLGTIIRTAVAANASGIILTEMSTDIYNPKTVRSSAANMWKIPIVYIDDKSKLKQNLDKFTQSQFIATVVAKNIKPELYYKIDYTTPVVLLFGSEAEGLSDELANQADKFVTIPMNERVESINLSVSTGVILYEAVRQRESVK